MDTGKLLNLSGKRREGGYLSKECFSFVIAFNIPMLLCFCAVYHQDIRKCILFSILLIFSNTLIGITLYSIYYTWIKYRLKNSSRLLKYYSYAISGFISYLLFLLFFFLIAIFFHKYNSLLVIALLLTLCLISLGVAEFNCFLMKRRNNKMVKD